MNLGKNLAAAVFSAVLGALIAPALAQNGAGDNQSRDHGMSMGQRGSGMMGGGMMGGGMMGGCAGMMQSKNNGGDGRPNSQWQKQPPRTQEKDGKS